MVEIAPWLQVAWQQTIARHRAGNLPHALLIAGPTGLGKRVFAQALAHAVLCLSPTENGAACGACRNCKLIASGAHPDLVSLQRLEDSKEIKVDQVRELSEHLQKTSQFGGIKVVLIEPAEAMNTSACNALLKTLEEPNGQTLLILVSDQLARLLATVRSRCQRIDVRFPNHAQALEFLATQGFAADKAELALTLTAGNPGDALQLLQQGKDGVVADVVGDMAAILAGRIDPQSVAQRWAADRPAQRIEASGLIARLASWSRAGNHSEPSDRLLGSLRAASENLDLDALSKWWTKSLSSLRLLESPLRTDLVILDLLREWRKIAK